MVGTALFASINAHKGRNLSRRDDLESLIYSLIYMICGTLPWKNIKLKNKKERHQIIMHMKEELCHNAKTLKDSDSVPIEILKMLAYVTHLKFNEEPNYIFLKA